jgi:hypothetical protein
MITCSLVSSTHIKQKLPLPNTPDWRHLQQADVLLLNEILQTSHKCIFQFNENYIYYIFLLCILWITVMRLYTQFTLKLFQSIQMYFQYPYTHLTHQCTDYEPPCTPSVPDQWKYSMMTHVDDLPFPVLVWKQAANLPSTVQQSTSCHDYTQPPTWK